MTVGINDPRIQQMIDDANRGAAPAVDEPNIIDPPDTHFRLAAGYVQDNGQWTKDFEVRELTGRDEEALARIPDVGRGLAAMIDRSVLRLGNDDATSDRLDSLMGGDWDTILLAVRTVTFGSQVELKPTCQNCRAEYEVTIDLASDISIRTANPEDLSWSVEGRRHTYEVSLYTGSTQRKIYDMIADDKTVAVLNTEILHNSVDKIDGMPVLGTDQIRDLSIADRRVLLDSIQDHRVGPDLQGVKIKCPTCGHEQPNPLNAAALFQWN